MFDTLIPTDASVTLPKMPSNVDQDAEQWRIIQRLLDTAVTEPSEGGQDDGLAPVKQALQEIIAEHPHGVIAGILKILLEKKLSSSFDEKNYGFGGFIQLLEAFKDVVEIKEISDNIKSSCVFRK